jgi:hypothetical protein
VSERPRRPDNEDGDWTDDCLLGAVALPTGLVEVHLRQHQHEEPYHRRNVAEFVPLLPRRPPPCALGVLSLRPLAWG